MAEKKITKGMSFGEVLQKHPEAAEVMMKQGMHCIGCAAASFETIARGAETHGIDADKLVDEINKAISKKGKKIAQKCAYPG